MQTERYIFFVATKSLRHIIFLKYVNQLRIQIKIVKWRSLVIVASCSNLYYKLWIGRAEALRLSPTHSVNLNNVRRQTFDEEFIKKVCCKLQTSIWFDPGNNSPWLQQRCEPAMRGGALSNSNFVYGFRDNKDVPSLQNFLKKGILLNPILMSFYSQHDFFNF